VAGIWSEVYWAWVISELVVIVVTRTRRSSGTVRDRGSILVLWVVIFSSITAGSWYGAVHTPTIFGGAGWVKKASVAILVAGVAVRWTAIVSLGRAFSVNVAIHEGQRLYRKRLFAAVRHPSYTGMLIIFAAIGVRTMSWIGLGMILLPSFAALLYRIHVEEEALTEAFGEQYLVYSRTAKRFVPGIY
jgi:protein-S-isoprenylcysteine O-methyltransferase Ste14